MLEQKINNLLTEYLIAITAEVEKKAAMGHGRRILGGVENRTEDVEISLDRIGDEILSGLLAKYKLKASVFSESSDGDIKVGDPEVYVAIDPFDGSALYLKGFEENWYSCLSFYDKELSPMATGIAQILSKKFYITQKDGNYLVDINTGKKTKIFPSDTKSLKGKVVLASYVMSSVYSKRFLDVFGDLIANLHPKALFYPNGGAFVYGYLAEGLVDAYIMFDEPRSEIDPGLPIAKKAGCEIVSVNPDGSYQDYEFVPGKQHEKVDLFIASSTPELRDELINYYVRNKK